MLAWDALKAEFVWEGGMWLRDVCVRGVGLDDWRLALDALRVESYSMELTLDGLRIQLPEHVSEMFPPDADDPSPMLSIDTAGVRLNCHFFDENEIVFDLDAREVGGQPQLDALIVFMTALASATGKFAVMTPEGMHEHPIIRVNVAGAVEYISSDGFFEEMRSD